MRNRRKRRVRFTTQLTRKQFIFFMACLAILMAVFIAGVSKANKPQKAGEDAEAEVSTIPYIEATSKAEPSTSPEYTPYGDPNNYVYPYNTMSADWGAELYESGLSITRYRKST